MAKQAFDITQLPEFDEISRTLKVSEVARLTRTTPAWVYARIKAGDLIAIRLPGKRLLRIPASELSKFRSNKGKEIT